MITLALVEDDLVFRRNLAGYLDGQDEFCVVTQADSIMDFVKQSEDVSAIDILILDIGLSRISGLEGIKIIREKFPSTDIIIHTIFSDAQKIFSALCSGARGYILKNMSLQGIRDSLISLSKGGAPMSPEIARKVVDYFGPARSGDLQSLTTKENQVVKGLVDGLSYKLIADRLSVSIETVRFHIKNIYRKLEVNSKCEVIVKAYRGEI